MKLFVSLGRKGRVGRRGGEIEEGIMGEGGSNNTQTERWERDIASFG